MLIVLAAAAQAASINSAAFDLAMAALLYVGQFNPNDAGLALQMVVPIASYNNSATVTISGSPTGGTFTLSVQNSGGVSSTVASTPGLSPTNNASVQTTTALAYNATAAAVQTALAALPNVGAGNVTVTGSNGGPYTVTLSPSLCAQQGILTLTASATGLTGGTPAIAVAVPTYSFQVNTSPDGVNWTSASRAATVLTDAIPPSGGIIQIGFSVPVRYVQLALTMTGTAPGIVLYDSYISTDVNRAA